MEMTTSFGAYAAFILMFAGTPGSSTTLVVRNALQGGRPAGLQTVAGIASASSAYAVLCALGMGKLLLEFPLVLPLIRWLGAGYLVYLAYRTLRPKTRNLDQAQSGYYLQGLWVGLANVSVLLLYVVMIPPFARAGPNLWKMLLLLNLYYVCNALLIHGSYAVFVGRLSQGQKSPIWADRLVALMLLILAILIVSK
jgi:threonine/homoserine/homoserine lactone efflux protein